jgi:hypothetical protein
MKDSEARGMVLQRLYDIRHEVDKAHPQHFEDIEKTLPANVIANVLSQLSDKGMIKFDPHRSSSSGLIDNFQARILGPGVDVIEKTREPPIAIVFPVSIDSSVSIHGSQGVIVGGQGNVQNFTMDVEKMNSIIDSSDASLIEREEAKSLLKRLSENRLVRLVLAKLIGS